MIFPAYWWYGKKMFLAHFGPFGTNWASIIVADYLHTWWMDEEDHNQNLKSSKTYPELENYFTVMQWTLHSPDLYQCLKFSYILDWLRRLDLSNNCLKL